MTRLSRETILITGASSGIGAACARLLADRGASLLLMARRQDAMDTLAASLDVPTHCIAVDVRDTEAVSEALANLPSGFQAITALVNNAGLALGLDQAWEQPAEDIDTMIDTNTRALVHMTRAVVPGMLARGKGTIVQIGSVAGNWPYGGGAVYCATKAFVRQFSLSLRGDLHGTPIRVTDIQPGLVETPFSEVRFKGDVERAAAVYAHAEALQASDIAELVAFCLERPPHVNINTLEVMPTSQSFAPPPVHRRTPPTEPS